MDYKIFGSNIRKQRNVAGMTIGELAENAEISENFLGKIERGQAKPSLETILKISDALCCGIDLFLGNELKYVNEYLEKDISEIIKKMDVDTQKKFLEFIKINGDFFLSKLTDNH